MKMLLIRNQIIKAGSTNSAAGKQTMDWNDENIRADGGAHASANW
jgi:hypothetical protein